MTTSVTPPNQPQSRMRAFCKKVLDILFCIFCCRCVTAQRPDESYYSPTDTARQPATTLRQRNNPRTMRTARPRTARRPVTHLAPPPTKQREDNQHAWTKTLWTIHERRLATQPKPVDELRKHHRKRTCWSWQWFPAERDLDSSPKRQACAFRSEYELMTYYRSKILLGDFLELAELAVLYPMVNPIDEWVLAKSLLLCHYAAQRAKDYDTAQRLNLLLLRQRRKNHKSVAKAKRAIGPWLKAHCKTVPHWPFEYSIKTYEPTIRQRSSRLPPQPRSI